MYTALFPHKRQPMRRPLKKHLPPGTQKVSAKSSQSWRTRDLSQVIWCWCLFVCFPMLYRPAPEMNETLCPQLYKVSTQQLPTLMSYLCPLKISYSCNKFLLQFKLWKSLWQVLMLPYARQPMCHNTLVFFLLSAAGKFTSNKFW